MEGKTKNYDNVIFTPEAIREAIQILEDTLPDRENIGINSSFKLSTDVEERKYSSDEEFFSDYRKYFTEAHILKLYDYPNLGEFSFSAYKKGTFYTSYTIVKVELENLHDVEKVFNHLESYVDKCRIPKQPEDISKPNINWITETVEKIESHCPNVARKIRLAINKLETEDVEEWQNAAMQIRDAWIELSQWLCKIHNIDTSDISPDSVIDGLKKLKLDKSDERIFNLARASFQLSMKHHKRDIDINTVVACVISTIVSMKTVIQEVTHAIS